MTESIYVVI